MPEPYAVRVALDKAHIAAKRAGQGIVIAADTIVVAGGKILGKPVDEQDAAAMLDLLSGRQHQVVTGLAVIDVRTGRILTRTAVTSVWFRTISSSLRDAYVASGEPLDKAGAYGIQEKGALLVDRIQGCYFNVVGLPLSLLGEMLEKFGVDLWSAAEIYNAQNP